MSRKISDSSDLKFKKAGEDELELPTEPVTTKASDSPVRARREPELTEEWMLTHCRSWSWRFGWGGKYLDEIAVLEVALYRHT